MASASFESLLTTTYKFAQQGEYEDHGIKAEVPLGVNEARVFAGVEDEGGTAMKLTLKDGEVAHFTRIAHLNLVGEGSRHHYLSLTGEVYGHYMADGEGEAFRLGEDMLQALIDELGESEIF